MSLEKDQLFKLIKERLPENVLFVEEIADVLNISCDASYRRINGKTSLSFKEALLLARHYKISLNDLSNNLSRKILENGCCISMCKNIVDFYRGVSFYIESYTVDKESKAFYLTKDIPIYHIPVGTLYNKFKIYVYLSFLLKTNESKIETFSKFINDTFLLKECEHYRKVFKQVSVVEVWNDTTIDSSLHTIYYFYKTKYITRQEALQLCDDILLIIETIEEKAKTKIWDEDKKTKYELYYNKLANVNHTLLLKSKRKKGLLIPYTYLSYVKIESEEICEEVDAYFQKKLQFSKNISGSSEVERKIFFTMMYEKIEQLKKQIRIKRTMSFL